MGRAVRIGVFVGVILLGTAAVIVSGVDDPLWQKAVAIASANENWVPGYVIHNEEVYSRIGIRQENTVTHSELHPYENRDVEVIFLKILQNGEDITEEFTEEFGDSMILEEDEYLIEHPFRPSSVTEVVYRRLNKRKNVQGKKCIPYAFTFEDSRGTWEGTAWLEEESGTPLLVQGTLVSVPLTEKWYTVSALEVTTSFTSTKDGEWYADHAVIDSHIEVVIKLFQSYKSRIIETYTFKDYWRYE